MKNTIKNNLIGMVAMLTMGGANASTVFVDPSVISVVAGGTFTATISADFTAEGGATGGGFLLTWDSAVLTLNDAASGASADIAADIILGTDDSSVPGSLEFSYSTCFLPPCTAALTLFDVYDLTFDVNPAALGGTPVDLSIGVVGDVWFDADTLALPEPTFVGATVTVSAVPVPPAVWLFGSGLLGLVGVARRRSPRE